MMYIIWSNDIYQSAYPGKIKLLNLLALQSSISTLSMEPYTDRV